MTVASKHILRIHAAFLFAAVLLAPHLTVAATLHGVVIDAYTEQPLAGVPVVVDGHDLQALTDADGAYAIDVADGLLPVDLWVLDGSEDPMRYIHQTGERSATLRVLPPGGQPTNAMWWGLPANERPHGPPELPLSLDLLLEAHPLRYTVGATLPTHIRVGRRFASSCSGNPVQRVDTVALEDYVEGVLVPEIGVFRSIAGGPESSRAVFQAFAVAARSYAVWFYLRNPDAEYHIDDTACNQRYEEARQAFIRTAVDATAGQIMVARSDVSLLDKLEYAASCGRYGSLPEYQESLVPDVTGNVACVGSWCGHNGCAAHEVNPAVPDAGRCLVRGICQWGSAERSMRGDTYLQILNHYQPNTQLRGASVAPASASLVGFVREGDVFSGPAVAEVLVSVDTGESQTTDAAGYFDISDIPPGERTVTYSSPGIVTVSRLKVVEPGIPNWASQAVERVDVEPGDTGVADAGPLDAGSPDVDAGTADTSLADSAIADAVADVLPADDDSNGRDALDEPTTLDDVARTDAAAPIPIGDKMPRAVSIVGPEGLGSTGLSCASSPASGGLFAALAAMLAGRRRRVRCPR